MQKDLLVFTLNKTGYQRMLCKLYLLIYRYKTGKPL